MTGEKKASKIREFFAASVISFGSFITGNALAWSGPVGPLLLDENSRPRLEPPSFLSNYEFEIDQNSFAWLVAMMSIGGALLAPITSYLLRRIGRLRTQQFLATLGLIGWILMIWAKNIEMLFIGRFISGAAAGSMFAGISCYNGEIAEKQLRGVIGTFLNIEMTIGTIFVYTVGYFVTVNVLNFVCGLMCLFYLGVLFLIPESPLYLLSINKQLEAETALQRLRGRRYSVTSEMTELREFVGDHEVKMFSMEEFKKKSSLRAFGIMLGLVTFQQWTGINAIVAYANMIFGMVDENQDQDLPPIIMSSCQLIATFGCSILNEATGRRLLFLITTIGTTICTLLLGIYFYVDSLDVIMPQALKYGPIVLMALITILFGFGFGSLNWVVFGEIFPCSVIHLGTTAATTINWIMSFIITLTFPYMVSAIYVYGAFFIYTGITFMGIIFIYFYVIETKGLSLQEIQNKLDAD